MCGEYGIPLIGDSPSIQAVIQTIQRLATTDATVLLTGESGTGKRLVARRIHDTSSRRAKPFVVFSPVPFEEPFAGLALFGFARDVATGVMRHIGRIELANGGTLLVDEIGDLSLTSQAKLLRVLQERELESVGAGRPIPIDIRFIATASKDLKEEVRQNRFRQDFFFRLNVIHIHMPALREIRTDIPLLATHFLRTYASELGRDIQGFSQDALKALATYGWPGNIAYLKNTISRAVAFSEGNVIRADDLNLDFDDDPGEEGGSLVAE
jgi:DNA-binding NtrC family response regulator